MCSQKLGPSAPSLRLLQKWGMFEHIEIHFSMCKMKKNFTTFLMNPIFKGVVNQENVHITRRHATFPSMHGKKWWWDKALQDVCLLTHLIFHLKCETLDHMLEAWRWRIVIPEKHAMRKHDDEACLREGIIQKSRKFWFYMITKDMPSHCTSGLHIEFLFHLPSVLELLTHQSRVENYQVLRMQRNISRKKKKLCSETGQKKPSLTHASSFCVFHFHLMEKCIECKLSAAGSFEAQLKTQAEMY